jgi:uncharacterized membrane protein YccC
MIDTPNKRKREMIQAHLPTHFTPSSNDLLAMIASAEAKFAGDRKQALSDRAGRAFSINAKIVREVRAHDMRRHVFAGGAA